ncbi:MAG: DUF4349 domain-containing protein [Actinomycetota bacterium]|nr:DUF4349 domain-containing protein [Actinomycetota bacterium]
MSIPLRLPAIAAGLLALGWAVSACGAVGSGSAPSSAAVGATAGLGGATKSAGAGFSRAAGERSASIPAASGSPGAATGSSAAAASAGVPDVVEHASLSVRVAKAAALSADVTRLGVLAARDGGYVQYSTVTSGKDPAASLTLRVPDARLPAVIGSAAGLGTVRHRSESGLDVTGQVVDLALEQSNLEHEDHAVAAILARATNVADVLAISQELFDLQGQIQQVQAQRRVLSNQVAYADLAVTLTASPVPATHRPGPGVLVRAWGLATSHTAAAARAVVLAVGWAAPGLLVVLAAAAAYVAGRRLRRRSRPA